MSPFYAAAASSYPSGKHAYHDDRIDDDDDDDDDGNDDFYFPLEEHMKLIERMKRFDGIIDGDDDDDDDEKTKPSSSHHVQQQQCKQRRQQDIDEMDTNVMTMDRLLHGPLLEEEEGIDDNHYPLEQYMKFIEEMKKSDGENKLQRQAEWMRQIYV